MPPRSLCLNVFTTSLSDSSAAGMGDGRLNMAPGMMARRDSAFSDHSRRSSAGAPSATHPISAINRTDLVHSLRPMASTESLNISLTSKPCTTCSGQPARRRCSRCKAAYYCDKNCQKSDWKTHRNACEPISQTDSAPATPNFSSPTSPANES